MLPKLTGNNCSPDKIMSDITDDHQHLAKLQDYYAKHRGLPSYTRICELLGFSARSSVGKVLKRLQAQHFIERTPDDVWVPARRFFARTVSDQPVPAGMPITATDVTGGSLVIDEHLVKHPSMTTLIPVKGDSMIDAHICDGDLVVVEKRPSANPGDIVVAIVDGDFTVKYLATERGRYVLKPANANFTVIRPKGDLQIFGIVVGIARSFRSR